MRSLILGGLGTNPSPAAFPEAPCYTPRSCLLRHFSRSFVFLWHHVWAVGKDGGGFIARRERVAAARGG